MGKRLPALGVAALAGLGLTSAPAGAAGPMLRSWSGSDLRGLVASVSTEHGVDPDLVDCVVRVESDYNPGAVSRKGAMGLMQLMPATVSRHRVRNPFDPEDNVRGGVRELVRLLDVYGGNLALALAAYNAGEGAVAKYGGVPPYQETRDYVGRILALYTGRPWVLGRRVSASKPVRLLQREDGQALISNYPRGAENGALGDPLGASTALQGGFGR